MINIVAVISVLLIGWAFFCLNRMNGGRIVLSITNASIILFILMIYIGSVGIVLGYDKLGNSLIDYKSEYTIKMFYFNSIGLIMMVLGAIIANKIFRYTSSDIELYEIRKITEDNKNQYKLIYILLTIPILIFAFYYFFSNDLPLFNIFTSKDLAFLRSESTNNFSGKRHYYTLILEVLFPILTISNLYYLKKIENKSYRFYGVFSTLIMVLVISSTLRKSSISLLLAVIIIFWIIKSSKPLDIKMIVLIGLVAVSFVFFMYFILNKKDISWIIERFYSRLIYGQSRPFYYHFVLADEVGFLHGRSFPNPGGLLGFETYPLAEVISRRIYSYSNQIVGTAPTIYYAEMYSNFGTIASLVSMISMGFYLRTIDIIFTKFIDKNPIYIAAYAYLIVNMPIRIMNGIGSIIIDFYMFGIISLLVLIKLIKHLIGYFQAREEKRIL